MDTQKPARRYSAYLSYSHADEAAARRLHSKLETYRVPSHLVRQGKPGRLEHVFRDRTELPSAGDLGDELTRALTQSAALIVLCSPAAVKSRWVNQEVAEFKRLGPGRPILPIIIAGEPPDCFPSALRFRVTDTGEITDVPEEPVAAECDADRASSLRAHANVPRLLWAYPLYVFNDPDDQLSGNLIAGNKVLVIDACTTSRCGSSLAAWLSKRGGLRARQQPPAR